MLMPNRHGQDDDYRYGFNGKENDDEVKGVKGSQQDYGFRIYDPRIGRFLSTDPLASTFPWYTPYQFAGNKPIKFIDIDGLEEGELVIDSKNPRLATLTWKKNYTVVTEGQGAVHAVYKLDEKKINAMYNSGYNKIYTDVLPGAKSKTGKYEKVNLISKKEFDKGKGYQVDIKYNIQISGKNECTTLSDASDYYYDNSDLEGIIMDESGPGGIKLTYPTAAVGALGGSMVYTNDELFGENPKDLSVKKHQADETGVLVHEIAHNFGESHKKGDYTQDGLMSNINSKIKPTKTNNINIINIINNNAAKIKTKK
tara:strand:- start:724 stop:1659 length:936 start_codon:yes stop_codon:yes gene_type:complete